MEEKNDVLTISGPETARSTEKVSDPDSTSKNMRERILDAASVLFARHGYKSVSTRTIAKEIGVRHGTVHYHFKTKEGLYTEVFRRLFAVDDMLTYDVLLEREPFVLDTPEGKAYAVQRVISDFYQRHLFMYEGWKKRLVLRELFDNSPIYLHLVEDVLKKEAEKMTEFYYLLNPKGSETDAYIWAHYPDAFGLYYMMSEASIQAYLGREFVDELGRNIVKTTTRSMIMLLDLPVPDLLK